MWIDSRVLHAILRNTSLFSHPSSFLRSRSLSFSSLSHSITLPLSNSVSLYFFLLSPSLTPSLYQCNACVRFDPAVGWDASWAVCRVCSIPMSLPPHSTWCCRNARQSLVEARRRRQGPRHNVTYTHTQQYSIVCVCVGEEEDGGAGRARRLFIYSVWVKVTIPEWLSYICTVINLYCDTVYCA